MLATSQSNRTDKLFTHQFSTSFINSKKQSKFECQRHNERVRHSMEAQQHQINTFFTVVMPGTPLSKILISQNFLQNKWMREKKN